MKFFLLLVMLWSSKSALCSSDSSQQNDYRNAIRVLIEKIGLTNFGLDPNTEAKDGALKICHDHLHPYAWALHLSFSNPLNLKRITLYSLTAASIYEYFFHPIHNYFNHSGESNFDPEHTLACMRDANNQHDLCYSGCDNKNAALSAIYANFIPTIINDIWSVGSFLHSCYLASKIPSIDEGEEGLNQFIKRQCPGLTFVIDPI